MKSALAAKHYFLNKTENVRFKIRSKVDLNSDRPQYKKMTKIKKMKF
jgi:hypothetical protein